MCENYFTKKEVESILKVSEYVLGNLIKDNKIEHFRINGRVRISESQVDRYLSSIKVHAENQMMAN